MHRFEWPDDESVEFHLNHGDWIRLLRRSGFEVEDLDRAPPLERARPPGIRSSPLEWARRWPSEEVWVARPGRPLDCRTMSDDRWNAVDAYTTGLLQPADPVLEAVDQGQRRAARTSRCPLRRGNF